MLTHTLQGTAGAHRPTGTVIKDHYPNTAHHQCPLSISHLLLPWQTSCLDITPGMTADVPDLPLPFPTPQESIPWLPWLLGASCECVSNKDEMHFSRRLPENWIITFQQLLQTMDLQQGSGVSPCLPSSACIPLCFLGSPTRTVPLTLFCTNSELFSEQFMHVQCETALCRQTSLQGLLVLICSTGQEV